MDANSLRSHIVTSNKNEIDRITPSSDGSRSQIATLSKSRGSNIK